MGLVMAFAEGRGSFCHCEPCTVAAAAESLVRLRWSVVIFWF